jgi:rod shape-determining protein MreB
MSVQGEIYLPVNQNKWKSLTEKSKLDKSIQRIEDAVMETLSQTPPELAADIYNTGIYLAGGGSMLRGLDKRISQKTDLPTLQKILYER